MKKPRSRILSPERAALLGRGAAALSLLVVVTCAGAAKGPVERPLPAPGPRASAAPEPKPSPLVVEEPKGTPAAAVPLAHFRDALADLASGKRTESVRVLWLGDSHAAADFWPDAIRKPLAEKYGNGGPGFLFVGLGVYRHAGVKVTREGHFRVEPKRPSLWMRQNDGVFGLGGMRSVPDTEACKVTFELGKGSVTGGAVWDLAFRLPSETSRFRVVVSGQKALDVGARGRTVGAIEHATFTTEDGATVTLEGASGDPQFLGVTVDSRTPGVVVDTLGINGARIGTPLAWEETPWVSEASRRAAELFVLAYGTNEVGDQVAPSRYGPELENLIARARKAAPHADCLVVGPTDRAGAKWEPLPRVAELDQVLRGTSEKVGCVYFSSQTAMGGEGSIKDWANREPPLAAPDRVHLTPRGYAELGAKMATDLLGLPPAAP
ncbi:MAG TPA: GDSL-type esterase/lipase family protein [Polyangiaceae bacterium]|nr:GDSL-type esterase/lipase family protein [Polyangiaceae bacterium]